MKKLFLKLMYPSFDENLFLRWLMFNVMSMPQLLALSVEYGFSEKFTDDGSTISKEDFEEFESTLALAEEKLSKASVSCNMPFLPEYPSEACLCDALVSAGAATKQVELLDAYIAKLNTSIDQDLSFDIPCVDKDKALNLAKEYRDMLKNIIDENNFLCLRSTRMGRDILEQATARADKN